MAYEIEFKKSVKKDTKKLPQAVLNLIEKRILKLAGNPLPSGVSPIKSKPGFYRIRVGNYRVLYLVDSKNKLITIYKISHRKDVYRDL